MYFFNCFDSGPNIIFNSLPISTIPLAPSFVIASLLAFEISFAASGETEKVTVQDTVDTVKEEAVEDVKEEPAAEEVKAEETKKEEKEDKKAE